jgi:hypothetical protein
MVVAVSVTASTRPPSNTLGGVPRAASGMRMAGMATAPGAT